MDQDDRTLDQDAVRVDNARGASSLVLVCEHASHFIPDHFNGLGLAVAHRDSHAAWDPGALAVGQAMARHLDAPLVASCVSRLVYDCNRPPTAPDAMPAYSEVIPVPGNRDLRDSDKTARIAAYYQPFHDMLQRVIARIADPVIVTIHSFTPIYHGKARRVEIGILHDSDSRLADAMLDTASAHTTAQVMRNAPYGPTDGVTHTLQAHGIKHGHLNVMLEIRNDLIATAAQQAAMAAMIAKWLVGAVAQLQTPAEVQWQA